MRNFFLLFSLIILVAIQTSAQSNTKFTIIGKIVDNKDNTSITQATIQLLDMQDKFIGSTISRQNGEFELATAKTGEYRLKVSFIGYKTIIKELKLSSGLPKYNFGNLIMTNEAIELEGAVITAQVPEVVVKEDTLIYNSEAYRVPEGSPLEELIKKLPGAEVDDDNNITINGRKIKKIMVEGKEFFSSDTKVAMKNLPVEMVDKIKAYERKSDLARITGIDDGEDETILDLTVKKGMKQGWFGNIDLSIGNKDRYSEKLTISRFADNKQITAIGSANNTSDRGSSGGGGRGLNASKTGGVNFAVNSKKIEFGGNVRHTNNDNDSRSISSKENFISSNSSFSNSQSISRSKSSNVNADFRLEWRPDSMTNIIFRPSASYSRSNSKSNSYSASFNENPYQYDANPLEELESIPKAAKLNSSENTSENNSNSNSASAELQLNRKLNDKGRNITIRGSIGYSNSDREQSSIAQTQYYQLMSVSGNDSISYRNRYIITPNNSWNYSAQFTYSEPIAKATFLQFSYRFNYKYQKSDNSTYSLLDKTLGIFEIPQNYQDFLDKDLSKFAENSYYNHNISLTLRIIRQKFNLSTGITLLPQTSKTSYLKGEFKIDTVRNVINFTPNVDFRYRASKVRQLRFSYRGRTSQPSITDLLPITDNSNPLNIREGNPGLKPSFSNSFNLNFQDYYEANQSSIQVNTTYDNTLNNISSRVTYDTTTGARTTRPENINGNWNAGGNINFNTAFKDRRFHINTNSSVRYTNAVGYFYDTKTKESFKNKTRTTNLGEKISGNFRNDWFEFALNGSFNYTHSRNLFQNKSNLDTYHFSYGANTNINFPNNLSISTNISNNSRRGYSDATMNRDELIWNAQLSYRFLKKNAATILLQVYDILGNQSNISRNISAYSRSDTQYNSINSYFMAHFIYKINIFGSKEARQRIRGMYRDENFQDRDLDNERRRDMPSGRSRGRGRSI